MKFDPTPENVRTAMDLAGEATSCTGYHASDDHMTAEDLELLRSAGSGPLWYVWSGTKEDSLAVAITGNGPTSKANAAFLSCARDVVLGLGEEVIRLRASFANVSQAAYEMLAGGELAIQHAEQCSECGCGGVGPLRDALHAANALPKGSDS